MSDESSSKRSHGKPPAKKLICQICKTEYAKKEHLERHERTHTGDKPFSCPVCGRAFSRQDSLARHEGLHRRPKPQRGGKHRTPSTGSTHSPDLSNLNNPRTPTGTPPRNTNVIPIPEFAPTSHARNISNTQHVGSEHSSPVPGQNTASDPQLMWPDLEGLMQTVIGYDDPNTMPTRLDILPFATQSITLPAGMIAAHPQIGLIEPNGMLNLQRPQAVSDVSQMVSAVSERVNREITATSITSRFLDECLHMFFTRFNRAFPLLHQPTFVLGDCTHPLLLNAIALGSLYLGSTDAIIKGEAIWRLVYTAVSTSWQNLIKHRGQYDSCSGIQLVLTALLGQTYANLSKNESLRTTSHIFHSLGFFWARHCSMLDITKETPWDIPALEAPQAEKTHKWRIWAAKEIQRRAVLGHYILDGQIAMSSSNPTSTRHTANKLSFPVDESAFAAENVEDWLAIMRSQAGRQDTSFASVFANLVSTTTDFPAYYQQYTPFSLRVIFEGLQSLVQEADPEETIVGIPPIENLYRALAKVFDIASSAPHIPLVDKTEAMLRWHAICLDLAVDMGGLCRTICHHYGIPQQIFRPGIPPRYQNVNLRQWAVSSAARRALLHATTMVELVEQLPQGRSHSLHLPASLFAAATVYCAFSLSDQATVELPSPIDWKDVTLNATAVGSIDPNVALEGTSRSNSAAFRYLNRLPLPADGYTRRKNLSYELSYIPKILRFIAQQWGVAREMADIVDHYVSICH